MARINTSSVHALQSKKALSKRFINIRKNKSEVKIPSEKEHGLQVYPFFRLPILEFLCDNNISMFLVDGTTNCLWYFRKSRFSLV